MPGDVPCADWLLLMPCPQAHQDGPSQNGCLPGKMSGTLPNLINQSDREFWRKSLLKFGHSAKMSTWRDSVLAAEAKKAGSASEDTRLTPRPSSLSGRLAWVHWMSLRSELVISCIERLRNSWNFARKLWPTDGEHLKRWRTFGELKDDLKCIKASWELMVLSTSTALARSLQCLFHALSSAGLGKRGAL